MVKVPNLPLINFTKSFYTKQRYYFHGQESQPLFATVKKWRVCHVKGRFHITKVKQMGYHFSVLTEASQLLLSHIVVWWQQLRFSPKQTTTISHLTQNTSKTGSWYLENSWSRTRLSSRNQFWWFLEKEKHRTGA